MCGMTETDMELMQKYHLVPCIMHAMELNDNSPLNKFLRDTFGSHKGCFTFEHEEILGYVLKIQGLNFIEGCTDRELIGYYHYLKRFWGTNPRTYIHQESLRTSK